ncbi:MAG: hypothetical protein D6714_01605 [Bacteroidetes bacterium]|nr:MAG: hypothetical protein D6714_01605 [Bacteroidota bacterium]
MKKTFICLANSKKYGARCIAGIEVIPKPTGGWKIVRLNSHPKWVRPVSNGPHGEVSANEAAAIKLLDVVEFEALRPYPNGYQTENVLFRKGSLRRLGAVSAKEKAMSVLSDKTATMIFGEDPRRVPTSDIQHYQHSLLLARLDAIQIYYPVEYKTMSPRAKILFRGRKYDLPVTDIQTILALYEKPDLLSEYGHIYGTFSLGMAFEGYHYKILAGLIYY